MTRSYRLSIALLLAILAVLAIGIATTRVSALSAEEITIDCSTEAADFGTTIDCSSNADRDSYSLAWGDGYSTAMDESGILTGSHAPVAVGAVEVAVVDDSGATITSTTLTIEPDLSVVCESGIEKDIYELAPSTTRADGWDYVYFHPDTGEKVLPGNPDHPVDPGLTSWEPVITGSANAVGECVATSNAAEQLDGKFEFSIITEWGQNTVPFPKLTPWSSSHWLGTQPGEIEVVVTVNDLSASERQGVHLSGCN